MMKAKIGWIAVLWMAPMVALAQDTSYLAPVRAELRKAWPKNRAIQLVFHGHSVPAGYFATPAVHTLEAYPQRVLQGVKALYPTAVVNTIVTAIGGENSEQGAKRFEAEVLTHRPDVLFIDYGLNDRAIGLARAKAAWTAMIQAAQAKGIKVILLTPSPDTSTDWASPDNPLHQHAAQIRALAEAFHTGLADSYAAFAKQADVQPLMAQNNHPNGEGHQLIAGAILNWFQQQ